MFRSNSGNRTNSVVVNNATTAASSTTVAVDAVPVLAQPYPVPSIYYLYGKRPTDVHSSSCWIKFRTVEGNSSSNNQRLVLIDDIRDPLMVQHRPTHIGKIVVSIDGTHVQDIQHAERLLVGSTTTSPSTGGGYFTLISRDVVTAPFCKLVVGTYNIANNPGVAFASTRDETLVQVSRVFTNGAFQKSNTGASIRPSDIVLAVNGFPVSTTDSAYRALQLSKNITRQDTTTALAAVSIYAVDITHLRCSILREIKAIRCKTFQRVRVEAFPESEDDATFIVNDSQIANVQFNNQTQHLIDKEQHRHRFSSKNEVWVYQKVAIPFLRNFNQLMDTQMTLLEESVACETWNNPVPYPQLNYHYESPSSLTPHQVSHQQQQIQRNHGGCSSHYSIDLSSCIPGRTYSNGSDPTNGVIVDAVVVPLTDEDNMTIPIVLEECRP